LAHENTRGLLGRTLGRATTRQLELEGWGLLTWRYEFSQLRTKKIH